MAEQRKGCKCSDSSLVKAVDSKEDFEKCLQNAGDKLVVVDFYAQWCGPCKMIAPKIEEMAVELMEEVIFLKVDVDECDEVAQEYEIEVMPTFKFFKHGKKVDDFMGANGKKLHELICKKICKNMDEQVKKN